MFKRITALLLALSLCLIALPVSAAERVATLPDIAPVLSGRFDFALAVNKQVLGYGQGEFSGDRVHAVFVDAIENSLIEIVTTSDRVYVREGAQTRWVAAPVEQLNVPVSGPATPAMPSGDLMIYKVGDADVAGASTTQYQIDLGAAGMLPSDFMQTSGIKSAKLDLFVGANDRYLHKMQITMVANDPQLGDIEMELVMRFSAFNQPIAIGAPPADLIDELPMRAASYKFGGSRLLPTWARPLFANRLLELRQAR
jgi:hypothetical protein